MMPTRRVAGDGVGVRVGEYGDAVRVGVDEYEDVGEYEDVCKCEDIDEGVAAAVGAGVAKAKGKAKVKCDIDIGECVCVCKGMCSAKLDEEIYRLFLLMLETILTGVSFFVIISGGESSH